jgi:metal-dependent amidase/aminoacylase/carboxypeptidase family protein
MGEAADANVVRITRRLAIVVAAAVLHLASARADAQTVNAQIDAAVERLLPSITEVRHRIHQFPELSNREFKTARLIADHLRAMGLDVRTGIAHTGVVAFLKGGKPGRVMALRADMDALPVTEDTALPFKSQVTAMYD